MCVCVRNFGRKLSNVETKILINKVIKIMNTLPSIYASEFNFSWCVSNDIIATTCVCEIRANWMCQKLMNDNQKIKRILVIILYFGNHFSRFFLLANAGCAFGCMKISPFFIALVNVKWRHLIVDFGSFVVRVLFHWSQIALECALDFHLKIAILL